MNVEPAGLKQNSPLACAAAWSLSPTAGCTVLWLAENGTEARLVGMRALVFGLGPSGDPADGANGSLPDLLGLLAATAARPGSPQRTRGSYDHRT